MSREEESNLEKREEKSAGQLGSRGQKGYSIGGGGAPREPEKQGVDQTEARDRDTEIDGQTMP